MQVHSYLLVQTLVLCNYGTVVIDSLEVSQYVRCHPYMAVRATGNIKAREAQCVCCTDEAITFSGSAGP